MSATGWLRERRSAARRQITSVTASDAVAETASYRGKEHCLNRKPLTARTL